MEKGVLEGSDGFLFDSVTPWLKDAAFTDMMVSRSEEGLFATIASTSKSFPTEKGFPAGHFCETYLDVCRNFNINLHQRKLSWGRVSHSVLEELFRFSLHPDPRVNGPAEDVLLGVIEDGVLLRKHFGEVSKLYQALVRVTNQIQVLEKKKYTNACHQLLGKLLFKVNAVHLSKLGNLGTINVCRSCSKTREEAGLPKMLACSRCRSAHYSKMCQATDWKSGHRLVCTKPTDKLFNSNHKA